MSRVRTLTPDQIDLNSYSLVQCTFCFQTVKRYAAGFDSDGKHRKWVDATGRRFNGKCCPRCLNIKLRVNNTKRRQEKQVKEKNTELTQDIELALAKELDKE